MEARVGENSAPIAYTIGSGTGHTFAQAFKAGCKGRISYCKTILSSGDVAMFGHVDLFPLLRAAQADGRNWYYGDKAYFNRGDYYRITKNAYMHDCSGEATPKRFENLKFSVEDWQTGSEILLCPQSDAFYRLHGTTQAQWILDTTAELMKYTDRQIAVHYKNTALNAERRFKERLNNVWAVVVYTSMAGAQAVMRGVPCFATQDCVSAKFGSMDLSSIERPRKPDNREQMAWVLADNQWTLEEIRRGIAWQKLK
jgi:hypothetical protein